MVVGSSLLRSHLSHHGLLDLFFERRVTDRHSVNAVAYLMAVTREVWRKPLLDFTSGQINVGLF